MTRFLNGPVLNLLLVAGIGLSVYYAATLTERGAAGLGLRRQHGVRTPPGHPRSVNAATLTERGQVERHAEGPGQRELADSANPRSVNVAYRRHSYPVDFRHRWLLEKAHRLRTNTKLKAEHAYAQRLLRELRHARTVQAHVGSSVPDWRAKQIAAAETIGHEAGADPWPNCPDPIWDGASSWDVTVACENGGSWLDSPGYYRCGLQFDPMWERRFGALCP